MARSHRSTARLVATTAGTVVGLVAVYAAAPLSGRNRAWGVVVGLAAMTAVIPLLVRRIRAVLATDKPVAEAIAALIMTSTLIVVGSASAYFSLESSRPGQFRGLETKLDAAYFAVVVMSTIGFGDIAPTGQAARLLTTLHIVVTVSLVGAAVRLLGWAARQRLDRD